MVSKIYPKFYELLDAGTLDWGSDSIKIILLDNTYTYNRTHDFVSDILSDELTGYMRPTLGTKTSADNGTNKWVFDGGAITIPGVTANQNLGSAVVYKEVTNDADSPILAYLDGEDILTNGSDISLDPVNGYISIEYSTGLVYPKLIELLDEGTLDWGSDSIKIVLLDNTYTYNRTHDFVSDILSDELTGYMRPTLGTKTSADNGTDKWVFDAADPVVSGVPTSQNLGSVAIYKEGPNDTQSPLLGLIPGDDLLTNGGDVTIAMSSGGVITLSY